MTEGTNADSGGRIKFLIGGLLIVAAVVYLIVSSTQASAQYYLTIDELITKGEEVSDRDIKISGAVDGDTIDYDSKSLTLRFTIVNVPGDLDEIEEAGGLAEVLHEALVDPEQIPTKNIILAIVVVLNKIISIRGEEDVPPIISYIRID